MNSWFMVSIGLVWYILGALGAYWILRMQGFDEDWSSIGAALWFFALPVIGAVNLVVDVALALRKECGGVDDGS